MLTHIVWWTFKAEAEGRSAAENAAFLKERLETLPGKIPSLKGLSAGIEILGSSTEEAQLVLVTRHDDAAGLADYVSHPEHQALGVFFKAMSASRRAIDFME